MNKLSNKNLLKLRKGLSLVLSTLLFTNCFLCLLPSYAQSGFSNIGSFFQREERLDNSTKIDFDKALTIKQVLIEGNRLVPEEHILNAIDSKAGTQFNKDKVLSDLEAIDRLGYFVRDSIQASPEQTSNGILLKIRIEENNPITRVQILGNEVIPTDEILLFVQDLIGKPESLTKISKVLDQIEKKYQESGYVLARVTDIGLDPDGTLTVKLDEGLIDKVVIKGNTKTKEKYIRRFTPNLVSGEPYNELLLVQDFRALQGTGLFEDIHRTLTPSGENPGKYDLNIEIAEKRNTSFGFGGGVNTLNGVFANLGFNNSNLFGEAKRFSFNTQFGTGILANSLVTQKFLSNRKTMQVEARYSDPNFLDTKNSVSFFTHGYTFNSYLVDLAQEKNLGLGFTLMRPLGKNVSGGFDLIGESVQMKDYGSKATDFLTDQLVKIDGGKYLGNITEKNAFQPGQLFGSHEDAIKKQAASELAQKLRHEQLKAGNFIQFNPTIAFDTRDTPINPRNGWNNKINFGQAIGIGNNSFSKLGIDLRRYIPIGEKTTLAFNLQGASSLFGNIPMYSQFKAGGYYGVRGYRPFSDLGIGSRTLLASAEIRTPLLDTIPGIQNTPIGKDLRLVLFGDLGYVGGNDTINRLFNRLTTAASAGIGIRANIPMLGAIRVDYGLPFIKPLWNSKNIFGRFNFGLGDRF
ncbi:MAG: BamA/TamA family outer membrane protein [Candidatus Melainabacteria bacterium]|nr:BamA/TamA family outer membrane protein [Candidatus Melainabacteria bacterium]